MKKYTRALEKEGRVVFATTTKHGVGAIHFRHKLPSYKIKQAADSLKIKIYSEFKQKHHLLFRNRDGDLIGTLVNQNLLLMPKYTKTKSQSVELAEALLEIIP